MLRHLGIGRVRLLTDDPAAPRRLMECGIEVAWRATAARIDDELRRLGL